MRLQGNSWVTVDYLYVKDLEQIRKQIVKLVGYNEMGWDDLSVRFFIIFKSCCFNLYQLQICYKWD